ncbi:hypothetical protein JCGZ_00280 [Jatropha curcas]|uniref:Plus3 domain-containing protein n=2 Tax=Jatropha curcas TaxID=180498 RepID=A0A067L5G5_JATCU|nr:hypothetical protein JCGZ_00280 [Jatropha curcas]
MPKDIPTCKLSEDNFSKEECEDLRQRVEHGRLGRPTVVDFKEKATSLHEVITKHWIVKELARLQKCIDQANEKGWRREFSEYMERLKLLQTPSEQARLSDEVPEIIADEAEIEPADKDLNRKDEKENNTSPKSEIRELSRPSTKISRDNGISSSSNDGADFTGKSQVVLPETQHQPGNSSSGEKKVKPADIENEEMKNKQIAPAIEVIQLSDDEEEDKSVALSKQTPEDLDSRIWHIVSPHGIKKDHCSMSLLKEWSDICPVSLKFKVWKTGQSPEEAVSLADVIHQFFPV